MNQKKKKITKKAGIAGAAMGGAAIGGVAASIMNDNNAKMKDSAEVEITDDDNQKEPTDGKETVLKKSSNIDSGNENAIMQDLILKASALNKSILNI